MTDAPATDAPETDAPVTDAPETEAPDTDAPVTDAPETEAPATDIPATEEPTETVMTAVLFGMPVTITENQPIVLSADGRTGGTDTLTKDDVKVNSPASGKTNITYDPVNDVYSCDFDLNFKIPKEDIESFDYFLIPFGTGVLVPSNVASGGAVQTGMIKIGNAEVPALKYRYERDEATGRWQIRMQLDKDVLNQFQDQFQDDAITGFVRFNGSVAGSETNNDGSVDVNVLDDVTVNIDSSHITGNSSSSHFGSIGAKKSSAGYDPNTNTLTYNVLVYSDKGTMGNVQLGDAMTLPEGFTMQDVTVTNVEKATYSAHQDYIEKKDSFWLENGSINWAPQDPSSFAPSKTGDSSFEISAPPLGEKEVYYITYQVKVDGNASQVSVDANNKLKASSQDEHGNKVETSTDAKQPIVVSALSKSGKLESNGHIKWTLTVNSSQMDIADATLTDPMLQNALDGTISIQPSAGITETEGGYQFTATNGGKNTNSYTITYETQAPALDWFDKNVSNQAKLQKGDQTYEGQAVVGPLKGGDVKKAVTTSDKNTDPIIASYTTTVTLPEGGLMRSYEVNGATKQSILYDKMGAYKNDGGKHHAMTAEQANALKNAGIKVQLADGTSETWKNGQDYKITFHEYTGSGDGGCTVETPVEGKTYDGYQIEFLKDKPGLPDGKYANAVLTIEYSSTASTEGNPEGEQCWYNNNVSLLDHGYDANFFTYKKPASVQKMDGDGKTGTSDVTIKPDGTLTWKVVVRGEGDETNPTTKVHMVDTLPEGLELVSLKWGVGNTGFDTKIEGGQISSTNPWWEEEKYGKIAGSVTTDAATGKQTLTLDLSKGNPGTEWKLDGEMESMYVEYKCKLSDEMKNAILDGTVEAVQAFANSVKVSMNDGALSDPVTQTQNVSVEEEAGKELSKNVTWYTEDSKIDHRLHYQLPINPAGIDHNVGGKLTLEDELTYSPSIFKKEVSLHPGTVKLYYIALDERGRPMKDANGNYVKGDRVRLSDWTMKLEVWKQDGNQDQYYFTIDGKEYDYTADWTQYHSKLKLTIPDATPMLLEYDYDVEMTIPQEFKALETNPGLLDQSKSNPGYWGANMLYAPPLEVNNSAKLTGGASSDHRTDDKTHWLTSSQQVGLSSKGYELVKVDTDDMSVKLQGAEFGLFKLVNGGVEGPLKTYISDENGSLKVIPKTNETDAGDGFYFERDVLYFLEETKAPTGYLLPETETRFYFYHRSENGPVLTAPVGASGEEPADLSMESYTFFCYNQKQPDDTPTYLSVSKAWKDAAGGEIADTSTLPDVQFMVYQTVSETQPVMDENVKLYIKYSDKEHTNTTIPKGTKIQYIVDVSMDNNVYWAQMPKGFGLDESYGSILSEEWWSSNKDWTVTKSGELYGNKYPLQFVSKEIEVTGELNLTASYKGDSAPSTLTVKITPPPISPVPDGATAFGPYTLSSAGGWTWDNATAGLNLPKEGYRDGKKVYFTYYIREVGSLAGWTGSVMPDVTLGGETTAAPAEVTLTNTRNEEETKSLYISKLWHDDKGADLDASTLPESITVQVWRKADPTDELVRTVELKKAESWNASVDYLPMDGQYYVTEVDPPEGFTVSYSADAEKPTTGNNITVTNTKAATNTSLTVNKAWKDENGTDDLPEAERLASVQVQLMRRPVSADGVMTEWEAVPGYDVVTLTAPWTHTWNDLPRQTTDETTGATTEWIYTAAELPDSAPGFIAIGDENDANSDTVTLTNVKRPTTSIKVQKAWLQADGTSPQTEGLPESITVQLWYKVDGAPDIPPAMEGDPVTLTAGDPEPWAHTWENLPKQEQGPDGAMHDRLYYIEEIDAPFGFTVAYTNNDGVNAGEITVTNTLQETSVQVEKKWTNADGTEITEGAPEAVQVKLMYQRYDPATNEKVGAPEQYMNALDAENGCYTVTTGTPLAIDHLPTTLVVEGTRYAVRYFVEELPESGFTTTYSDNNAAGVTDATETLTITNIRAKGSLNVTKKYQDVTGNALNRAEATTIRFKLKQFTKDVDTGAFTELDPLTEVYEITVGAGAAEGAYAIDDLPIKDADGNDIWYQAVEVDDTGAEVYAELDPAEPQKLTGTQEPVQLTIINLETSVSVEKKWQLEGVDMTVGLPESVTLTLRRYKAPVDRDPSAPLASFEDTAFHEELTLTPDADTLWKASRAGLPAKVMEDGTVYEYLYYFTEDNVPLGWQHKVAADTNNAGIASGEATIVNEMITYTLPETGGTGTLPYTLGGLALMLLACTLLYNQFLRKRRDEQS